MPATPNITDSAVGTNTPSSAKRPPNESGGPNKPGRMLRELFGFSEYRPGQKAVIEAAIERRDVLAVMPTSGGKSLCYQVPALMADPEDGLTVVISPLVSLMKDQIDSLRSRLRKPGFASRQTGYGPGYGADSVAALHSGLPAAERRRVEQDVFSGKVRVLYIAPEKLRSLDTVLLLKRAGGGAGIYMIVIDEAHCISEWGHSFRPEYLFLATAVEVLGKTDGKGEKSRPPVMALTATADEQVRQDIVGLLGLRDPTVIQTGFDRPNLRYRVRWVAEGFAKGKAPGNAHGQSPMSRMDTIVEALAEGEPPAIVYVHTRRQTENIAGKLSGLGIPAEAYHAGMSKAERDRVQGRFMSDDLGIIVATVAFGMGVDKPNVRTVIHAGVPASIPAYVQEAGRGGRDGRPAHSTVLFSHRELEWRKELAGKGQTTADEARAFFNHLREISVREKATGRPPSKSEGKAGNKQGRSRGHSQFRATPKAFDLPKLGGVGFEAAADALRALEALGRVIRQYNVWAKVQVSFRGSRGGLGDSSQPTEGVAARTLSALHERRKEDGADSSATFTVAFPELARQAGATPAATQVALTRLTARGVVQARGRGILADLLIKPGLLSRRELGELTKRFEARSAIEARHLEEIGHYASLTTCRRARLLSYFGDGDAEFVAPCDGCDVCNAAKGSREANRIRSHGTSPTSFVISRALTGLRNVVFGSI